MVSTPNTETVGRNGSKMTFDRNIGDSFVIDMNLENLALSRRISTYLFLMFEVG
jgi:hypothetical protein